MASRRIAHLPTKANAPNAEQKQTSKTCRQCATTLSTQSDAKQASDLCDECDKKRADYGNSVAKADPEHTTKVEESQKAETIADWLAKLKLDAAKKRETVNRRFGCG